MKPVTDLSYREAINELETLLRSMQSNDVDIDRLGEMTRRATALIAECRKRLTATDDELKQILAGLPQPGE